MDHAEPPVLLCAFPGADIYLVPLFSASTRGGGLACVHVVLSRRSS